jgi:hypothetical protein
MRRQLTVTLPEGGKRFRSMIVITEDQYAPAVYYNAGKYTFTREKIGTRYLVLGLRTFFNQAILKISKQLMRCRIQRKTEQKAPGRFEVPNWDPVSQKKVRDALVVLYSTLPDQNHMFGTKEEVDPVRCLIRGRWRLGRQS